MKKRTLLTLVIFIISIPAFYGQNDPAMNGLRAISKDVLQAQLEFLASDWMEGRRTGEKGELIASDYIASMLRLYGVKPHGDIIPAINLTGESYTAQRSYFQNFVLIRTIPGDEQILRIKNKKDEYLKTTDYRYNTDFYLRPSVNTETEAPVAFAGYGLKNSKLKFDETSGLDISGKFIIRIAGAPEAVLKTLTASEINTAKRDFEIFARNEGAAGILEVNPDNVVTTGIVQGIADMAPSEKIPMPGGLNAAYYLPQNENPSVFQRISISVGTANDLLKETGNNIHKYISEPNPRYLPDYQPADGKTVYLKTTVDKSTVPVRNVLGIIEGNKTDEYIVLGAHYDHMGINEGYIWNGADDNASGTTGIMTIAKALMESGQKPDKTIIVALWTAEEQGLLGSEYFLRNLDFPAEQIRLNLNMDMISRYISDDQPDKVTMTYTAKEAGFRQITESNLRKHNIELDVDYQPSDDPPGGTDHRNFVEAGIPVMRFKPGHREEYHTPYDEPVTIDWEIMEKIVRISFLNILELSGKDW